LIGAGAIARDQHVPAWSQLADCQLVALADPSPAALAAAGEALGSVRRVADYRELLDAPTIDAVDICAPSALHGQIAVAALGAGKHVLCEKPMATSRAEAAAMLAAWRASGKQLTVGQHLRFDASVLQLRAYLEQHPPGKIYYARAQWLRRRRLPARPGFTDRRLSGGGALFDLGVHLLDLAWWMIGCPRPVSVSGVTYDHLVRRGDLGGEWGEWDAARIDVEDFAAGLVRFEGGAALSLEVSWLAFQPEDEFWRLQMYGTRAGISWPECLIVGEDQRIAWDTRLSHAKGEKAHHEVIRQFARSVLDGKPSPLPPTQSANVIAMLDALGSSAACGREVPVEAFGEEGGGIAD
jgi:predicted dehydrogenase